MSIALKLIHTDGLRLRQQTAQEVERVGVENSVAVGREKSWKFEKAFDYEGKPILDGTVDQDRDPRLVDTNGKKQKMGTYTVYITAGLKNLVVELKGKIRSFDFKNPAIRNHIRIRYQTLKDTGRKSKEGKPIVTWEDVEGAPTYIAPQTFGGAYVGDTQRAIVDEMPT